MRDLGPWYSVSPLLVLAFDKGELCLVTGKERGLGHNCTAIVVGVPERSSPICHFFVREIKFTTAHRRGRASEIL